jgi:sugar phosphate isomerase/epimerase
MSKIDRSLNTEVGNGQIDFKTIVAAASKSGVKHYFVEQENNYNPNIYGSIKTSSANAQQYLAGN